MARLADMASIDTIWLVLNARSGSNEDGAIAELRDHCARRNFELTHEICFPDDDLPTADALDDAGVRCLAVFTGDGTLNAAITGLGGWSGSILVLPGGTMNLLSRRMHGEASCEEILDRIANGAFRTVRPKVARCDAGDALAGLLSGPGTAWASVREAMRDLDIAALAEETGDALAETTGGAFVRMAEPPLGRREGYPMIEFTPSHRGLQLDAYHAKDPGDFLRQGLALLRRRFREGPHDRLGLFDELTLENCEGEPIEVLLDGEPASLGSRATFSVAACEVDLLATAHGY